MFFNRLNGKSQITAFLTSRLFASILFILFNFSTFAYSQEKGSNTPIEKPAVSVQENSVDPLIVALKDNNYFVRDSATEALIKIGTPAVEPLIAVLEDSNNTAKRKRDAIFILGEIKDSRAVEPLIVVLKDNNNFVQSSAARALGEIKDKRAEKTLRAALRDRNLLIISGAYRFFIRKGNGIVSLTHALNKYGDKTMAEDFLNSNNTDLEKAARIWAKSNNIIIVPSFSYGHDGPIWKNGQ